MSQRLIPRRFFLTRGMGVHRSRLVSFELALRDARIPQFNLVAVSSILPPHCEPISVEDGLKQLSPGEIVFCVLARADTDVSGRPIGAGIGLAQPPDPSQHGYISEHHGDGLGEQELRQLTEHEAVIMLATSSGADEELSSRDRHPYETCSIAQAAAGAGGEQWTTVIAAAVFIMESGDDAPRP